jgi:hypothetical protein
MEAFVSRGEREIQVGYFGVRYGANRFRSRRVDYREGSAGLRIGPVPVDEEFRLHFNSVGRS